ncbi:MAG: hypothetical protein JNM43_21910, partial [Planctomycetaceae bacterium]|nr:hypothetical protein [Planctomycetaceae bacterium]
ESDLKSLAETEAESIARLTTDCDTQLRAQLERLAAEARDRVTQVELDISGQREAASENRERRLQEIDGRHGEVISDLRSKLQNELWVLQSVCDENNEDTPVRQAERAEEIYHTHQTNLQQRLNDLQQTMLATAEYLRQCHAAADTDLPPAQVELKSRETARNTAIESIDKALNEAATIDRRTLPQWIIGWRILGLALLIFLVVMIPVTIIRADITKYLNPSIGKPDWEWLGVSSLIGAAVAFLFNIVLLVTVQSRLRGGFSELLQHVANANAAAEYWNARSRNELKKLTQAAEKWKTEILQKREHHAARLNGTTEQQIQALMQEHSAQTKRQQEQFDEQMRVFTAELDRQTSAVEQWKAQETQRLQKAFREEVQSRRTEIQDRNAARRRSSELEIATLTANWKNGLATARQLSADAREKCSHVRRWNQMKSTGWNVPVNLPSHLTAGQILATFPELPNLEAPTDPKRSGTLENVSGGQVCIELPAILNFPTDTSIVVEHDAAGREVALEFVRAILLQLLTNIVPGRVQFTLIDPVGLGQSFSAMMHLADFDELLISNRIWTESVQIRDRLQKVTEHMESVFQTYLRSEFQSIEDYNKAAGEVAEPYHFVVVAGFPGAFSEEAARHLTSILTSGPRCGVHTILTWSPDQAVPRSFDVSNFQECALQFKVVNKAVVPACLPSSVEVPKPVRRSDNDGLLAPIENAEKAEAASSLEFEALASPDPADYVALVRTVGAKSKDARRVEVSFSRIAPKPDAIWSLSTADGIDFPIGRAGAARLQFMRLGRGTSQHVLIAGKTGSGKSTLMHILITNLALYYSPDEIQFYLIDFKKGVEFRTYAANRLPHARVIAIESDREFGLSVLERLDEILQERGELFRIRGVQDVPSFRRQFPKESMPRLLLLIDEFQEFFTTEDRVSSRASLLLDRLIRQGRAFGIHVVLGSQTLGGAYSLARSTLGQVAVRIALQCSESDAHLILSEQNSAARLLTRPGEAIYNDANGMVEGNHPFQIAWLDEEKRESMIHDLEDRTLASDRTMSRMIVFEGNVPPSPELCAPLNAWISGRVDATRHFVDAIPMWVGEPVSIAAPVCLEFHRSGGQNLLLVGQESDLADSIFAASILSWCGRNPAGSNQHAPRMTFVHDGRDAESLRKFESTFTASRTHEFQLRKAAEVDSVITDLFQEMTARENGDVPHDAPEILLAIRNLGQFRTLRREEDDFGMGAFGSSKTVTTASMLGDLIRKGPLVGIHLMIWADTFSNAMRWLSNSLLREFDTRIAFRLNQTDSASLIDTPAAASLSQGRAILYRDQTGSADRFRPFSWPGEEWLKTLAGDNEPNKPPALLASAAGRPTGTVIEKPANAAKQVQPSGSPDVPPDDQLSIDDIVIE